MTRPNAARAHAIFTRALDLEGADRDEMVTRECGGDAALEARVRRLLAAMQRSTTFLGSPAVDADAIDMTVPEAVGSYVVVGVLGSGGMATVYEAVQENPHRRVALKVMREGLSHTDAHLRFRLETEALARLRHPGIAQIYEAGTARLGQPTATPFFAMELVPDALPITEYAATHGLSRVERLRMLASVCDAITHGHQHGLIHRDLKPGNVLVGPEGLPKVIDFGIARSIRAQDQITQNVDARRIIGTLNYMSPEQYGGEASVDARADVYALGVILFELVLGRLPHDVSNTTIPVAIRQVTQTDAPRARDIDVTVPRDLQAIMAKALERDPARRYTGADALAADIRRFLDHRPIDARHTTTFDAVVKLARRNRIAAAAFLLLAITLVLGAVVSIRYAVDASRARDAALQREHELEAAASVQEAMLRGIDAVTMGDRIRQAFADSLAAERDPAKSDSLKASFARVESAVNFTSLAIRTLDENILQRYRSVIDSRLRDQPLLRARMLVKLADSMRELGAHAQAEPVLRDALALRRTQLGEQHEDSLQTQVFLGNTLTTLGRYDEALALLREALGSFERLRGPDHPLTLRAMSSLAGVYRRSGELTESERLWRSVLASQRRANGADAPESLQTLNNLGVALAAQGRLAEAEQCWRELLERRRKTVGADSAEYRSSLGNLGVALQDQHKLDEARPLLEEALASDRRQYGDRHSSTLTSMFQLAGLLQDMGELECAESLLNECVEGRRERLGAEAADTLAARAALGSVLYARGAKEQGEEVLAATMEIQSRVLGDSHPMTISAISTLAGMKKRAAQWDQALALCDRGLQAAAARPGLDRALRGELLLQRGELLFDAGRPRDALPSLIESYERMVASRGPQSAEALDCAGKIATILRTLHSQEPSAGHDVAAATWQQRAQPEPTAPSPPRP